MCLPPSSPVFYNRISQQFVNFKEDAFKIITTIFVLSQILRPGCFLAQELVQEARAGGGSTGVRQLQALADEEGEVPTAPNCPLIPHLGFVHVFPPEEYLVLQGLCLHWPFMDFSR